MPKLMQHCFKQKSLQHIRECFSNFICIYLKHRSTRCIKELLIAHRNCLSHFSLTLAEKRLYRMTLTISQGVINYITFPVSAKGLHIPACLKRGEIHNYQSVVESVFVRNQRNFVFRNLNKFFAHFMEINLFWQKINIWRIF